MVEPCLGFTELGKFGGDVAPNGSCPAADPSAMRLAGRRAHQARGGAIFTHPATPHRMSFPPTPTVRFMVERPDGLWLEGVYGTTASGLSAWVGSVDLDGVEQWRKELAPCGTEVPTQFLDAAKSDNGVWGILRVETGTGPVDYEDLVVRLDWQGDIAEAYRIEIPNSSVHWGTLDLAVAGDAVVIGGVASDDFNAPKTHWVARVL